MEREMIIKELKELKDSKYKEFHQSLCPELKNIIGIRVPVLRKYAKEIVRRYNYEEIIQTLKNSYYEETLLKGMIIGLNTKGDIDQIIKEIKKFVPEIDNWATCDIFCAGLKITLKYKEKIFQLIKQYLESNKEFEIRFAIVMLLDYYIEDKYIEEIFKICDHVTNDGYYAKMAVAWCISICFIKYYDKTLKYLVTAKLDKFTYNKALQKTIESYRITQEQKAVLKSMKRRD